MKNTGTNESNRTNMTKVLHECPQQLRHLFPGRTGWRWPFELGFDRLNFL